ncbi:hypothetical protein LWI29_022130 [Acer saccharum]|uniref:Alpha-aminoacylpeptide hydrolase n=1 Tax=Acer saccharum TaxID=4024 RepID=A0AA39SV47_ACESA|nr:hypothetical protein LWI29_022130 [Acer saccharum]
MNIEQFKGLARLPKFAIPSHYDLHLKLDLSAACTFSGTVKINLSITEKTNFLVLNANQLHVHQALFTTSGNQQYCPSDVVVDDDDEVVVLVFDETLCVGKGLLGIEFSGKLNEHLKGINGVKKNMAVTQFEAAAARRCFPCWDEPALKATFKITLDAPSELTTLSNMPIIDEKLDGNVKTVYFEETLVMSTYLVAVVVGLFDHIEDTTADGVKVRAYCPVGRSDEGKFALELTIKSLDIFTKYFSTSYPLPVEVEVHHVHGVEQVLDDIGYRKGSAVIRILHGYLGDDIFQVCYDVVNISTGAIPDSVNVLKEFFISLLQCSAEKLGWESIPGESHLDVMLRGEVFMAFATFGHDKTRREAMQRFQVLLNDKNTPLLSADVRKAAYISVMRNSSTTNRNGFESAEVL